MGNNSLQTTEKNLRSIAKRYENVKYSVGLAVLFLVLTISMTIGALHIKVEGVKSRI